MTLLLLTCKLVITTQKNEQGLLTLTKEEFLVSENLRHDFPVL